MELTPLLILEGFAVGTGLMFIYLLIKENIWCWLFGIISSAAQVVLMYKMHLYSESFLYVFYIFIGIYGWWAWNNKGGEPLMVKKVAPYKNVLAIGAGVLLGYLDYELIKHIFADAERAFADAFSSSFSIVASYLEAQKWLSSWIFWIIINAFSVWLYYDRGLKLDSGMMVVYFLLSIWGLMQWRHSYETQKAAVAS